MNNQEELRNKIALSGLMKRFEEQISNNEVAAQLAESCEESCQHSCSSGCSSSCSPGGSSAS